MILKVGDKDKHGRKIVQISEEGWYKDEHGAVRDVDGYEWFGHEVGNQGEAEARIEHDDISGDKVMLRDFKIAMMAGMNVNPKEFLAHWEPTVKDTLIETGFDFAYTKGVPNLFFGEGKDGYAHIYVRCVKKAWRNRENIYSGARQGQSGKVMSKALLKAGAVDPHIYGTIETDRQGGDILGNK